MMARLVGSKQCAQRVLGEEECLRSGEDEEQ